MGISIGVCRPSSASVLDVSATSDLLVRAQRNPCHFKFYLILATSRKLEKRIRTSSSLGAALRIVTASPCHLFRHRKKSTTIAPSPVVRTFQAPPLPQEPSLPSSAYPSQSETDPNQPFTPDPRFDCCDRPCVCNFCIYQRSLNHVSGIRISRLSTTSAHHGFSCQGLLYRI